MNVFLRWWIGAMTLGLLAIAFAGAKVEGVALVLGLAVALVLARFIEEVVNTGSVQSPGFSWYLWSVVLIVLSVGLANVAPGMTVMALPAGLIVARLVETMVANGTHGSNAYFRWFVWLLPLAGIAIGLSTTGLVISVVAAVVLARFIEEVVGPSLPALAPAAAAQPAGAQANA